MAWISSYFSSSSIPSVKETLEPLADKNLLDGKVGTFARYAMAAAVLALGVILERNISQVSQISKEREITNDHISIVHKIEIVAFVLLLALSITFNYFSIYLAYEFTLITLGCGFMALVPESLANFSSYVAKKFQ